MKILIASTGAPGHLKHLLSAAGLFIKHGHEVAVQTSVELKPMVEAAGIPFLSELPEANTFSRSFMAEYLERQQKVSGLETLGFDLEYFFARHLPAQAEGLKIALRDFPADLILADSLYWGTLPMLLGPRDQRPAIAHLSITIPNLPSGKNLAQHPGSSEEERRAEQEDRELLMLKPGQIAVNRALASIDCAPLPYPVLESMAVLPDLHLYPRIESLEYPNTDGSFSKVRYIGSLPLAPGQPNWRAKKLAMELASHDPETELLSLIEACVLQLFEA